MYIVTLPQRSQVISRNQLGKARIGSLKASWPLGRG
jgi:hypothetical protein